MSMKPWMIKSFKNGVWTTLGWLSAPSKEDAWRFAWNRWGDLVTHVTDFDE